MVWQFWFDVGGTFTDCLARAPDGRTQHRKVLSSSAVQGRVAPASQGDRLVDAQRIEPPGFWTGYQLHLRDGRGQRWPGGVVRDSAAGWLVVTPSPQAPAVASSFAELAGWAYELVSPEEAPLLAIRLVLGLRLDQPIPPCRVRLGTTRGTNALLTRQGARTALVTTRGLGDLWHIGYQDRPDLFALEIRKAELLVERVAEVHERLAADGSVLVPLDLDHAEKTLRQLREEGIQALAICLMHSTVNPRHEQLLAALAQRLGFAEVSLSSQAAAVRKLVPRGDTCMLDAYLNPVLRRYVAAIAERLPGSDLRLMTSTGGLVRPASFTGKDSLLSGPAGGVVALARLAQAAGLPRVIGLDMGGTSTDVARYDGRLEYPSESHKAGVRLAVPTLAIETVAAGGGSICRYDGIKLVVGPASAGADPGPACYGRGGPLTITDCNLLLGRLAVERFPFPLHPAAAAARLEEIARQVGPTPQPPSAADPQPASRLPPPPTDPASDATARDAAHARTPPAPSGAELLALAAGFVRIANLQMAQAIRAISIRQGYDMRDYTLVAFGSAGPQHACAVADELGMRHVLIPAQAGVLSALGIGLAEVRRQRTAGVYAVWDAAGQALAAQVLAQLAAQVRSDLTAEGVADDAMRLEECLELRYVGTEAALSIPRPDDGDYAAAFAREHHERYGYVQPDRPLEVVLARVEGSSQTAVDLPPLTRAKATKVAMPHSTQPLWTSQGWQHAGVFLRPRLEEGMSLRGPALIVDDLTTTVLETGWQAEVLAGGGLWLSRHPQEPAAASLPASLATSIAAHGGAGSAGLVACGPADPVLLEVFHRHFTAIATQMGLALRNTAISVNVKERLDFSCALFTARGELVVNAPHIPVHLGAMSQTVRQVLADQPDLRPGDVIVTNDPYRGGSHLPDITVITPVFDSDLAACLADDSWARQAAHAADKAAPPATLSTSSARPRLVCVVASRAHHAEIGGCVPGSMPPFARSLAEEGVLLRQVKLIDGGQPRWDAIRALLSGGPYPSRDVATNLADLQAQVAANRQGVRDLAQLVARYSWPVVAAYMDHLQAATEAKTRAALAALPPGRRFFRDFLDDGTPICAAITLEGGMATVDFSGTGPVSPGNLNANPAIVTAAILYVLRLLLREDLPLNQGMLRPIRCVVPPGLLNPPAADRPEACPAVAGGNVETSQRVVDVLLGALELCAASQGTMNNLLLGDATFGYYETIGGGSGATPTADGADAVHTHMTNTRITDPEVLEARYPLRLLEFSIRRGSGGRGRHRGGNGIVRSLQFLRPLTLSILSQRRGPYPPYGLAGGESGALGENVLQRADGTLQRLPGMAQVEVQPGDIVTIRTPGGGGWGPPAT